MPRLKILVVDNEPWIRNDVSRILRNFKVDYPFFDEAFEYEVLEAESNEKAIPIIRRNMPEIVFLGKTKEKDEFGVDILDYIRQRSLNLFIIIFINTLNPDESPNEESREDTFDYIAKPFTAQELKSSVKNVTKKIFVKAVANQLQLTGRHIHFQFLSMLSHELKAPLNAVEGYIEMIRDRQFGEDLKDYDHIIFRVLERIEGMRNVVLDLLDLTKLEARDSKKERKPVYFREIASTAIDLMTPYAIQRDITIELNCEKDLFFCANHEEMEIILNNLISNAVKYNKQGGIVTCSIDQTSNSVIVTVSDSGIGMTAEEKDSLFRDFTRIKNEKTKNIPGSGLGLSIIKKLVDSYNGNIEVRSEPDYGSTFIVTLPINEPCT